MAFLRSPFAPELPPALRGERITLRTPEMADHESWAALRLGSRDFLTPWEPLWPSNDLTRSAYRIRIKRYWRDIEDDAAYPFFIFENVTGALLGAITLSNVRRGVAQMASLGYWIGQPYARAGYMSAAAQLIKPFAFQHLQLHRIEAACLPVNAASISLLKRNGFHQEGVARGYLKINGLWQDHLLFACLAPSQPGLVGP
jgi:[ribosomal protein S5]-alanine N-acetyltransferase